MRKYGSGKKVWFGISLLLVMLIMAVGIFFYHNFFRQNNAQLIEAVPPESSFILQINNNEDFVRKSSQILPYMNELFYMSALPGFEFFIDQFALKKTTVMISGYFNGENTFLLLSANISESVFSDFLKRLRIDHRNFIPFDKSKIYTYGTHLKKFSFSFNNNVISISEDVELLKKSIVQHKHPRNLLSDKTFSRFYQIVSKNEKQNWLIIHNSRFFNLKKTFFSDAYQHICQSLSEIPDWSIFQIRFQDKEMILSGYMDCKYIFSKNLHVDFTRETTSSPAHIVPFSSSFYSVLKQPFTSLSFLLKNNPDSSFVIPDFEIEELIQFQLNRDTIRYQFIALKMDTNQHDDFFISTDNTRNNEITTQRGNKIYFSSLNGLHAHSVIFQKDIALKYFTHYQNYYIFADTAAALDCFLQQIRSQNFTQHPNYQFAKSNLPSYNGYEFCMLISDRGSNISPLFSDTKWHDNTVRNLQVFAFSFAKPEKNIAPVNVYIKFK
jgi:hypothetical protein